MYLSFFFKIILLYRFSYSFIICALSNLYNFNCTTSPNGSLGYVECLQCRAFYFRKQGDMVISSFAFYR